MTPILEMNSSKDSSVIWNFWPLESVTVYMFVLWL